MALRESKRCAVGRWAARGKQYIVMIRPVEDGLVMQQLMYAGEVRPISEIDIPNIEVRDAELKLAKQLIDQQTSATFDPSQYTDEVTELGQRFAQRFSGELYCGFAEHDPQMRLLCPPKCPRIDA